MSQFALVPKGSTIWLHTDCSDLYQETMKSKINISGATMRSGSNLASCSWVTLGVTRVKAGLKRLKGCNEPTRVNRQLSLTMDFGFNLFSCLQAKYLYRQIHRQRRRRLYNHCVGVDYVGVDGVGGVGGVLIILVLMVLMVLEVLMMALRCQIK